MTQLPLVEPFATAYMYAPLRSATWEEMCANRLSGGPVCLAVRDKVLNTVTDAYEAARHITTQPLGDGELGAFIREALETSEACREWDRLNTEKIPPHLWKYQNHFQDYDLAGVTAEIIQRGWTLSPGQCLFHAGVWPPYRTGWITERPFSTTFSPEIALLNAEFKGKAARAGEVHLYVLKVLNPNRRVYPYPRDQGDMKHEMEVVFEPGIRLQRPGPLELIRNNYLVTNGRSLEEVPISVLRVDVL